MSGRCDPLRRCVVIPALDEEATIAAVVRGALAGADEVIVVDNGSADRTAAAAASAGARVLSQPERGYGAACDAGSRAAPPGSLILFLDGDGSDDVAALERAAAPVLAGEADLVLGSRVLGRAERGALSPQQAAGNRLASALIRRLWGAPITDLGPMRAIRREDLLRLGMRSRTYGWPVEMLIKAARAGLRIEEVPVDYRRRTAGRSKVGGSLGGSLRSGLRFAEAFVRYGLGPPPR